MKTDPIDALLRDPDGPAVGELSSRLLSEFFRDRRPIEDLRRLLNNPSTESIACWLLYELGDKALVYLSDADRLLASPSWEARRLAVQFVLGWAPPTRGEIIARAIALIDDDDVAVRWRCASMLVFVKREQLVAASLVLLERRELVYVEFVDRLLDECITKQSLGALMLGASRTTKLCAMIAALRAVMDADDVLELAALAQDDEVSKLARDELEIRSIPTGFES